MRHNGPGGPITEITLRIHSEDGMFVDYYSISSATGQARVVRFSRSAAFALTEESFDPDSFRFRLAQSLPIGPDEVLGELYTA
jgi:hypothetical protein